ncbi:MAG: type II toxin-antitoxin system RelE/ParE family toxin [Burkholderiaceae bacterium]
MSFRVRLTPQAAQDLERLFDFVLERELQSASGDLRLAEQALQAIRDGLRTLELTPFSCRKAGDSPFLRELVIPFGRAGYVALFEIADGSEIVVAAVRHQREDDFF